MLPEAVQALPGEAQLGEQPGAVFDPAVRADTARRITAFTAAYPQVRTVVTSREYGYRPADFTANGFTQVILQNLERGQVEEFVRRWYTAAHPENPDLASRLTQRLLDAVRQVRAVAELAGNPPAAHHPGVHGPGPDHPA